MQTPMDRHPTFDRRRLVAPLETRRHDSTRAGTAMKCVSALSTARSTSTAFHQILERLDAGMEDTTADLTLVFGSKHHANDLGKLSQAFIEQGRTRHILGSTGEA